MPPHTKSLKLVYQYRLWDSYASKFSYAPKKSAKLLYPFPPKKLFSHFLGKLGIYTNQDLVIVLPNIGQTKQCTNEDQKENKMIQDSKLRQCKHQQKHHE